MRIDKLKNSGYTLIEIMVGIVILSVVTGAGLAAYRTFDEQQKLTLSSKQIVSLLRDAQKRAQTGEKPSECPASNTLGGWKVITQADSNTVQMAAVCIDEVSSTSQDVATQLHQLEDPISVTQSLEVHFLPITGKVDTARTLTVESSNISDTQYTIEITSVGGIRESKEDI